MQEKTPRDTFRLVGLTFLVMVIFVFAVLWIGGLPPWMLPYQVFIVIGAFALLFLLAGITRYKFKSYISTHRYIFGYILVGLAVLQFIAYFLSLMLEDNPISLNELTPSIVSLVAFSMVGIMLIRKHIKDDKNSLE